MKINLILSSEEIEQLVHTHIMQSGFDTENKELDIEFKFDGEDLTAVVTVEDAAGTPKVKRTRRTREQMEADAAHQVDVKTTPVTEVEPVAADVVVQPVIIAVTEVETVVAVATDTYEEDAPFALTNPADIIGLSEPVEPAKTKGIFD